MQPNPLDNPYAAPEARLDDLLAEVQELADRGTRLGAQIIDGLCGGLVVLPMIVILAIAGGNAERMSALEPLMWGSVGLLALGLVAVQFWLLHTYSQTIGKRALHIKIVRTDGSRIGLGRIVGMRMIPVALLGGIPFVGMIVSLVDPLLIFRDDRRCLHDLIADTVVVKA